MFINNQLKYVAQSQPLGTKTYITVQTSTASNDERVERTLSVYNKN